MALGRLHDSDLLPQIFPTSCLRTNAGTVLISEKKTNIIKKRWHFSFFFLRNQMAWRSDCARQVSWPLSLMLRSSTLHEDRQTGEGPRGPERAGAETYQKARGPRRPKAVAGAGRRRSGFEGPRTGPAACRQQTQCAAGSPQIGLDEGRDQGDARVDAEARPGRGRPSGPVPRRRCTARPADPSALHLVRARAVCVGFLFPLFFVFISCNCVFSFLRGPWRPAHALLGPFPSLSSPLAGTSALSSWRRCGPCLRPSFAFFMAPRCRWCTL